jgi:Flp pilus assembly protein TadG
MIEFTLTFLPMVAFILLLMDIGWAVFKRATLQFAVREGCRYAVTNQVQGALKDSGNKAYGLLDSVKWVVQSRALGFLGSKATDTGYSLIQVRFYDPNASLTAALPLPTGCSDTTTAAPNWTGNLVEVSVENYQSNSLGPILRSATPLNFVVRSADRMEGNPIAGVPHTFNGTCP